MRGTTRQMGAVRSETSVSNGGVSSSFLRILAAVLIAVAILVFAHSPAPGEEPVEAPRTADAAAPKVQLAILLDTSGSMQGLINQARTQLWNIVNDLATSKKQGQTPRLEVALYEYGKSSLAADEGYLRQIVPLSENLDLISEKLFELQTNGGKEYCGWVINDAVEGLAWSASADDLKMIFIAGNEPFSQGPVDFRVACRAAIEKGITVNTIHCGPHAQGVEGHWQEGAQLADGSFTNIDHNAAEVDIASPFDKELLELSKKLNTTYVVYGEKEARRRFRVRQEAQDANAAGASPAAGVTRAATKASVLYRNSASDLVDAVSEGKVELKELKEEELPEELRKLSPEELEKYVAKKAEERKALQEQVRALSAKRDKFVAAERKKLAKAEGRPTLEEAVIESVRQQAAGKKFQFERGE